MKNKESNSNQVPSGQLGESCLQCGSNNINLEWVNHSFSYGSGENKTEIEAKVPVITCKACESEYLDKEGDRVKHEAVCKHLGVLNPTEIKELRNKYGYNQEGFAKVTKFGVASLNRWERGASIQSPSSDNFLRLLYYQSNMNILSCRLVNTVEYSLEEKFPFITGSDFDFNTTIARSDEFQLTPHIL